MTDSDKWWNDEMVLSLPRVVQIWSVYLELQAIEMSGPV